MMILNLYRALFRQFRSWKNDSYGQFLRSGGDELLVTDLNLSDGSWVIDFGGFRGDWTAAILERYRTKVLVVEPVPDFANQASERFRNRSNVQVLNFLIGRSEGLRKVYLDEDATGYWASGRSVVVEQKPLSQLLSLIGGDSVGVASINIEGGEYELLELLLETSSIGKFETLLIQFHQTVDFSLDRYTKLQLGLSVEHNLTWDYPFVWQRWDKRQQSTPNGQGSKILGKK